MTLLLTHSACLDHLTPPGHPERPDRLRAVAEVLGEERFNPLVRDLAVDRQFMFESLKRVKAWIPIDGTFPKRQYPISRMLVWPAYLKNTKAWIRVLTTEAGVGIRVEDHGRGFDAATAGTGFGMENSIRGRLEDAGGTVTVKSVLGAGTSVTMWLPC